MVVCWPVRGSVELTLTNRPSAPPRDPRHLPVPSAHPCQPLTLEPTALLDTCRPACSQPRHGLVHLVHCIRLQARLARHYRPTVCSLVLPPQGGRLLPSRAVVRLARLLPHVSERTAGLRIRARHLEDGGHADGWADERGGQGAGWRVGGGGDEGESSCAGTGGDRDARWNRGARDR